MPNPARTLIAASVLLFAGTDRGVVRNGNDKTMEHRSSRFCKSLSSACGYHHVCCAHSITSEQAVALIGTYVDHVAQIPIDKGGKLPMANTLSGHVQAAFKFLSLVSKHPISIHTTLGNKPILAPFIADKIAQRRKWQEPRPKREAYTFAMLSKFHSQVDAMETANPNTFLQRHSLVFNTQCLGIFTGSRVSEYSQSKGKLTDVSRVPAPPGTPTELILPIAFVAGDFVFLSDRGIEVPHSELFLKPHLATQLLITFRHDKSGRNFAVRKYGKGRDWLCPIKAATKLLYRAMLLDIPSHNPICAHRPAGTITYRWLRDTDVTETMRKVCIDTYTDPNHFLRVNITRIASHSNRVTAAVALSQAGLTIDAIAHRLRWQPASVTFYLRESASDIGQFTADTINGAQRNHV
jgi:hypothetical protein